MPVPQEGLECVSSVERIGVVRAPTIEDEIRHEPMLFGASVPWARQHGGIIMNRFLDALPPGWEHGIIDSRAHMLMPGWFGCIPGWHHDDVPRPVIPAGQCFAAAGQPDYVNPRYRSEHILMLVNAEVAPTQFACGNIHLPSVPDGEVIYRAWYPHVQRAVEDGDLVVVEAQNYHLYQFNDRTLHQGVQARKSGWRYFVRISRGGDRPALNEIRTQVQVYLPEPMAGW